MYSRIFVGHNLCMCVLPPHTLYIEDIMIIIGLEFGLITWAIVRCFINKQVPVT